jgi:hypothetical protein
VQLHAAGFSPLFLALTFRALAISAALPIRQNAVSQRLSLLTLPSPSVRWTGTWLPTAQFIIGPGTTCPDVATLPSATFGPSAPLNPSGHLVRRTQLAQHASTLLHGPRRPLETPGRRDLGGGWGSLPWVREMVVGDCGGSLVRLASIWGSSFRSSKLGRYCYASRKIRVLNVRGG